ncbi:hypothetical protein BGZ94_007024 [Podila epigama]|nr:hypothetical protein BGZ94_007024 [Podila epigama]
MHSINIQEAAADGNIDAIKKLLDQGVDVNDQDEFGTSALHQAASYEHVDLVNFLIKDKKANVNIQDEDGDTPLFTCETPAMVKILLDFGADLHHKNSEGKNALDVAIDEEWDEAAALYKELGLEPQVEHSEIDNDMSHLDKEADSDDSSSSDDDKDENGNEDDDEVDPEFKKKIVSILAASEADGIDRDEELKREVAKMLGSVSGQRGKQIQEAIQKMVEEHKDEEDKPRK